MRADMREKNCRTAAYGRYSRYGRKIIEVERTGEALRPMFVAFRLIENV